MTTPADPAQPVPYPADDVGTVPESHARLLFAVLLFRDGILSSQEFEHEVTAAFGVRIGGEIARVIAAATARTALRGSAN